MLGRLIAAAVVAGGICAFDAFAEADGLRNSSAFTYAPPDPAVFVDAAVIDGWVKNFDDKQIRAHAFSLWAAITAMTDQTYSVHDTSGALITAGVATFDTWFDEFEVFHTDPNLPSHCGGAACLNAHHLHAARQNSGAPGGAQAIAFNKYTREFVDYVNNNHYFGERALIDLNAKFDKENTPLEQRFTARVPSHAIMLKPTYWIVKRDRPTAMQYWKGPGLAINGTTIPTVPTPPTWKQIVVVDPTGKAVAHTPQTIEILTQNGFVKQTFTDYQIVGLDRFYWFPLSKGDVEYLKGGNVFTVGGVKPADLEVGDLALLVGMHVSTDEFSDWTWQTFFWQPDAVSDAGSGVKPPFDHYNTATAYYMKNRDGSDRIAFNPYLETPIVGPIFMDPSMRGADSNCMTCHHAAAFPTLNSDPGFATMLQGSYVAKGEVKGTEQWFQGRVKTFFMWGIVMQNQCVGLDIGGFQSQCVH